MMLAEFGYCFEILHKISAFGQKSKEQMESCVLSYLSFLFFSLKKKWKLKIRAVYFILFTMQQNSVMDETICNKEEKKNNEKIKRQTNRNKSYA